VPDFLHPHDHISIYALDCSLVRSTIDGPADQAVLVVSFTNALQAPSLHGLKTKPNCYNKLQLWDSLTIIANDIYTLPGRRVLFAVSTGQDSASKTTADMASTILSRGGIAFFSLHEDRIYNDPFRSLTRHNGGLDLEFDPRQMTQQLQDLITMLHGRYILEFARPDNAEAGLHIIDVKIPRLSATIRTTGITVPLADPAILTDPTTVPSVTPSPAIIGKHSSH
jgi:hypothetical protein